MFSVPSVKRRRDVHRPIHEGCVQRKCERKVAKRNVPEGERKREWIECAGGQTAEKRQCNHQAIAVSEGQEDEQYGEKGGGREQDAPRTHQTAEEHGERADKHQAGIEGTANPCALVVPESVKSPEIGHAEGDHPACERDNPGARNYAENPQQWLARNLRRHRSAYCARDIYRRWANCCARSRHTLPATASSGRLQSPRVPDAVWRQRQCRPARSGPGCAVPPS